MLKTGTLTKARILEDIAETNGFTRIKFLKTAGIVLEQIKSILAASDDILIARQQSSPFQPQRSGEPGTQ